MLLSDQDKGAGMTRQGKINKCGRTLLRSGFLFAMVFGLASCQPLYGTQSVKSDTASPYAPLPGGSITIDPIDERVGQQVRNQLLFLMQGGIPATDPRYAMKLDVNSITREVAPSLIGRDTSSGSVEITVAYVVRDIKNGENEVSRGKRQAQASFDRTGQNFANIRAERDAQNRAAREVAESIRLAVLGELSKNK